MIIVINILITQEMAIAPRSLKVALVKLKLMFFMIEIANMNQKTSKYNWVRLKKLK